jgi:hypothetical protein
MIELVANTNEDLAIPYVSIKKILAAHEKSNS